VIDGQHCGEAPANDDKDGEVLVADGKHGGAATASDTTNGGRQCERGGLVLQGLALTFARPRPPARTPLVLAFLFRIEIQYGKMGASTHGGCWGLWPAEGQGKPLED
jgi:hypothetical protein